jgi:LEA14-like dessication related protein
MKFFNIRLLIPLFSLLWASCASIKPVYVSKVEGSKIIDLSAKGIKAEIYIRINNPNSVGFSIYRSNFEAEMNGIALGKAYLKKKIRVKRKSDDLHTVVVESDFSKLGMADIPRVMGILKSKSLKIHLKGQIRLGKAFIRKTFPVDVTETVRL